MSTPHDACALALVNADDLPLPAELAPGGDADPDRPERWRDHEEDTRGPEPDDVVDSDETFALFAVYEANHGRDAMRPTMTKEEQGAMKHLSYEAVSPRPGTHVKAYCMGMRGAPWPFEAWRHHWQQGREIGTTMPRRLAKRRATRLLRYHERCQLRWGSMGHMAAAYATTATTPGFVRY